ncbi:hypothetical protein [Marinitoga sp. 1155]|uniref:hypothetical protein n=1 Tax=Marinitoga sp. 1155 TaxID=1428448 RepID=UPI0006598A2D|nr:hypothetical protein [Marinitoga sp. 1155]KLO22275.1 hypothetical protein X274_09110 [Marinitoga sp. 1155]
MKIINNNNKEEGLICIIGCGIICGFGCQTDSPIIPVMDAAAGISGTITGTGAKF